MTPALLAAAAPIHPLATLNAALNATAMLLLLVGYGLIKARHERAHTRVMLAAFGVSVLFLTSYLIYHFGVLQGGHGASFSGQGAIRTVYWAILISHIILAAIVPFLAVITIWLGLSDRRAAHRRLARWTFPIWLYVSITGVVVYGMLYHLYPAASGEPTIKARAAAGNVE